MRPVTSATRGSTRACSWRAAVRSRAPASPTRSTGCEPEEERQMRAIQVKEYGGPEVLELAALPDPVAADGLVEIEVSAAGVNFADTHQAENTYFAQSQ